MGIRITDLRCKEIIDIHNGSRYGYMGDLEIDPESGRISTLIVPGRLRLFGLLGREKEQVFSWASVCRFGEDIILVEQLNDPDQTKREEMSGKGRKK